MSALGREGGSWSAYTNPLRILSASTSVDIAPTSAMSRPNAFVTLLTTPSYLPGALVLLHSLLELHPEPRDFKTVCLVTPETVDAKTIGELRKAGWDLVIGVEPIGSGKSGESGLHLMGRPDLNFALTKLHLFRLSHLFSTLIYLDADVLPIQPLSNLFESTAPHVLSACPDTGWPDCFNSGVMVIRPRLSDWEGLRALLKNGEGDDGIYVEGNGSFDGADQGLLNEWFSEEGGGGEWNRLPFIYNVTPSAAYTYKPAYTRYGHKIKNVHFIGPNKPWSNIVGRPAGVGLASKGKETYDYPALIDRWFDVYDRHVRPTAAHAPDLAKRFAVPEHVAVWNLASGVPAQPEDRLDLSQLKDATSEGVSSLKPGQYVSLPLDGRVDLIMPKPKPKEATPPTGSPLASVSPPIAAPAPQSWEQQTARPATWDASRYSPPKDGQPEMSAGFNATYAPAWEESTAQQSAYYAQAGVYKPEPRYPTLPASVKNDQWYSAYHGRQPDRANLRAVFPWEEPGKEYRQPDRVFPRGTSPPPRPQAKNEAKAPTPPPVRIDPSTPPAYSRPSTMVDAMAGYRNAWDSLPGIQRYVDHMTGRHNAPTSLPMHAREVETHALKSVPPTPQYERENNLDRASPIENDSDKSGDGDDEDDDDEDDEDDESEGGNPSGARAAKSKYPGRQYRDRPTQTDRTGTRSKKIQVGGPGAGTSPVLKTFSISTTGVQETGTPTGSNHGSKHSSRQGSLTSIPLISSLTSEGVPSSAQGGDSSSTSRRFDPSTDIDVRKRDTQNVLERFIKVGSFAQSGGTQVEEDLA